MGTRNLTVVYSEGEYKVAKYCQWDGYPEGQGSTILEFLSTVFNKETFTAEVAKLREATEEEVKQAWADCGADPDSEWVNMEVSDRMRERYPYWNRDMGGEILSWIQLGRLPAVQNTLDFAADSLFCEWCYVIDLDKNLFEIYEGFNKKPLDEDERFHFLTDECRDKDGEIEYYPVRLVQTYSLSALPTKEQFIADLTRERLEVE